MIRRWVFGGVLLLVGHSAWAACNYDANGKPLNCDTQSEALAAGQAWGAVGVTANAPCATHYAVLVSKYLTYYSVMIQDEASAGQGCINRWYGIANVDFGAECDPGLDGTYQGDVGAAQCFDRCELVRGPRGGGPEVCFISDGGVETCRYHTSGDMCPSCPEGGNCSAPGFPDVPDGCGMKGDGTIVCISDDPPNCGEINGLEVCAGPPDVPPGCGRIGGQTVCPGDNDCEYQDGTWVCAGDPPPDQPPELPDPPGGPDDDEPEVTIQEGDNYTYTYNFHDGGDGSEGGGGEEPPPEAPPGSEPKPDPDTDTSSDTDGDGEQDTTAPGGPACGGAGQPSCTPDPGSGGGIACGAPPAPACPPEVDPTSGQCGGEGQPVCSFCGGVGQPSCTTDPMEPPPDGAECGFTGLPDCPEAPPEGEGFCGGEGQPSCFECGGEGQPACFTCGADGQSPCSECGGEGQPACHECGGEGQPVCLECGGVGQPRCTDCGGEGQPSCGECGGVGQPACGECGGAGQPACSSCGGAGEPACEECGDPGMPACATCGEPGLPPCGEDTYGDVDCGQVPPCSGDVLLCAIARNTHRAACGSGINDADVNEFLSGSPGNPVNNPQEVEVGSLDENVINFGAVCPQPLSFSVLESVVEYSFQPLCDVADRVRPIIIALAYLVAAFIIAGVRGRA